MKLTQPAANQLLMKLILQPFHATAGLKRSAAVGAWRVAALEGSFRQDMRHLLQSGAAAVGGVISDEAAAGVAGAAVAAVIGSAAVVTPMDPLEVKNNQF